MSAKTERAKLYAESAARVMATCLSEQRSAIERGKRTPAQAADLARRKYKSLRDEYLSHDSWDQSEEDWKEHGPFQTYAAFLWAHLGVVLSEP